jgi:hypothetical protein
MPILLWIVYPFAIWSACVAQTVPARTPAMSRESLAHKLAHKNE